MKRFVCSALLGMSMLLCSSGARAAPCAGFNDVDDASAFCPNVEWIRNRGVTLGCAAAAYCPNDGVSRLSMAAFMNRLGTALTPVQLASVASPGAVNLDASPAVCTTADYAIASFPRRAIVDGALNAVAPGDVEVATELVYSSDAGASWNSIVGVLNYGFIAANRWASLSQIAHLDFPIGATVRFGIRVSRLGSSTSADLSDSRCQLRVLIFSRDGTSSPY